MPVFTRSTTLEITNNIKQSILNYIRNSQIHDVPELHEDVKNELYYLLNNIFKKNDRTCHPFFYAEKNIYIFL
jgi:hypothetical protein